MRKDSPIVACSIAAVILLSAAAALVPPSAWRAATVLAHLGPTLLVTAGSHGTTAARAAGVGVLAAPTLLQDAPGDAPHRTEVRVCRRDEPRSCQKPVECPRLQMMRLHLRIPTSG